MCIELRGHGESTPIEDVIGGVAASSVNDFVFITFGILVVPKGMFYLAGKNDIGGDPLINFAEDAQRLYDVTDDPKKLVIVGGSDAHGVDLIKRDRDLKKQMIDWISNL